MRDVVITTTDGVIRTTDEVMKRDEVITMKGEVTTTTMRSSHPDERSGVKCPPV